MLRKSEGIVINSLRYGETSIIVKIFTRDLGLKSYLISGVRKAGSKSKMALYQPITLLDLVVYEKEGSTLQRISDAKINTPFRQIPYEFRKTAVALFIAETFAKTLYDNYRNEALFDWAKSSLCTLDDLSGSTKDFPQAFLIQLAGFLGFGPENVASFLQESRTLPFKSTEVPLITQYIEELIQPNAGSHLSLSLPLHLRRQTLDFLLDFYREQLDRPIVWKSTQILRQVLDEG